MIHIVIFIRFVRLKNQNIPMYNILVSKQIRRVENVKDILKEITRLRLERNWTEYELAKKIRAGAIDDLLLVPQKTNAKHTNIR